MTQKDFIVIKKFEEMFGGSVFMEEPGDRWIYEKDGHCYSIPDTFLIVMENSIADEKDHLLAVGKEITYDPNVEY